MTFPSDAIVITGLGMVSSLGLDVVTSCAASRAGMSRAEELAYVIEDADSFEMVPVVGHPLGWFAEGFSELGRLVRLGALAFKDLLQRSALSDPDVAESALLINLASGYYLQQAEQRRAENAPPGNDTPVGTTPPYQDLIPWYEAELVARMLEAVSVTAQPRHLQFFFEDRAGMALTLLTARDLLASGQVRRCIIGGIDSLIDHRWLSACDELGLLKTVVRPDGFMPGEAAAFLLLETYANAARRNAPVMASVGQPALKQEATHRFSEKPPDGIALSEVILAALEGHAAACNACFASINGDPALSYEWGNAWVRIRPHVALETVLVPAVSFGETRAAYGYIAACMGARAFARGYHPSESMLVWASSDSGLKGSFALTRGTYTEKR